MQTSSSAQHAAMLLAEAQSLANTLTEQLHEAQSQLVSTQAALHASEITARELESQLATLSHERDAALHQTLHERAAAQAWTLEADMHRKRAASLEEQVEVADRQRHSLHLDALATQAQHADALRDKDNQLHALERMHQTLADKLAACELQRDQFAAQATQATQAAQAAQSLAARYHQSMGMSTAAIATVKPTPTAREALLPASADEKADRDRARVADHAQDSEAKWLQREATLERERDEALRLLRIAQTRERQTQADHQQELNRYALREARMRELASSKVAALRKLLLDKDRALSLASSASASASSLLSGSAGTEPSTGISTSSSSSTNSNTNSNTSIYQNRPMGEAAIRQAVSGSSFLEFTVCVILFFSFLFHTSLHNRSLRTRHCCHRPNCKGTQTKTLVLQTVLPLSSRLFSFFHSCQPCL
jgi:hypothetical protein